MEGEEEEEEEVGSRLEEEGAEGTEGKWIGAKGTKDWSSGG